MPYCTVLLESFTMITSVELSNIVSVVKKTTCSSDPFPSKLLMSHLPTIIDIITHMINLCISTSGFPSSCKSAIVLSLIKKLGLDPQVLRNYRAVSNLSFLSKLIEKVSYSRILTHIDDNDLIDKFQSAYRCGHSTETALLRVYSDIVTMVGKGNGPYLVLLDLSAAFDTIDHDTLFVVLEKQIGITGSALQLLKSYFSDRSQRVLIDDVMSGVANIVCGVPQGSVLCPLKLCLYLLPLGAILKYHGIAYHQIRSDDWVEALPSQRRLQCICSYVILVCCLPTPMTLASGGSPMFPLVVHQPASPSIWPAVQSLRRGLSTNPWATMWCVCGCS